MGRVPLQRQVASEPLAVVRADAVLEGGRLLLLLSTVDQVQVEFLGDALCDLSRLRVIFFDLL